MQSTVGVGYSGFTEPLDELPDHLIPKLDARIQRAMAPLDIPWLEGGISIYSYFEVAPTGRKSVWVRREDRSRTLLVRVELVAAPETTPLDDCIKAYLDTWDEMRQRVAAYLGRKKLGVDDIQAIDAALRLPGY